MVGVGPGATDIRLILKRSGVALSQSDRTPQKGKCGPMSIANSKDKQVAVVLAATSKWQSDGRNTLLAHGRMIDDSALAVSARWSVGGAIAQKLVQDGFRADDP